MPARSTRTRRNTLLRTRSPSWRSRHGHRSEQHRRDGVPVTTESIATVEAPEDVEVPQSYTTESKPSVAVVSNIEPGAATGRRKEAVARVRITPGTGVWKVNGRHLESYLQHQVHHSL